MNIEDSTSVSISERANIELVDDLREHSSKYLSLCSIAGLNIGFFMYQFLKTKLHWYIAMPLGFSAYFVSRNILMTNCMDRIYYSSEHVYKEIRKND